MVVDLDPGAPAGMRECCAGGAADARPAGRGRHGAFPKTSGKKGMQLCCPIAGKQSADVVSGYAQRVAAGAGAGVTRRLIVSRMAKKLRGGKVFIDWSQNNAAKTTVAPYSLRAQAVPSVSTPLTWDEVAEFADGAVRRFSPAEVLERVETYGDLLAPLLKRGPKLPA